MRSIHLFGMGFTQTLAANSGQIMLWLKSREYGTSKDCILTPMAWRTDPREIANFLHLLAVPHTKIYGYFYSWGAGWFFRRLVKIMQELDLEFEKVVLCDPVARSNVMPEWLPVNPTSLMAWPVLKIPTNVKEVYVFYQNVNRPRAHRVVVEDEKKTRIARQIELQVPHEQMEDQEVYHNLVLSIIEESTREKVSSTSTSSMSDSVFHKL